MPEYEVRWVIESSGSNPRDAAKWVNDNFLVECESGDWTYEVVDQSTGETTLVTVPSP